jgi:hypothetical protein
MRIGTFSRVRSDIGLANFLSGQVYRRYDGD